MAMIATPINDNEERGNRNSVVVVLRFLRASIYTTHGIEPVFTLWWAPARQTITMIKISCMNESAVGSHSSLQFEVPGLGFGFPQMHSVFTGGKP